VTFGICCDVSEQIVVEYRSELWLTETHPNKRILSRSLCLSKMPHPPSNPHYYSDSTTNWWRCPVPGCSKWCKSKGGRVQHICAKHGTYQPEPSNIGFRDLEDDPPQTPTRGSSPGRNNVYFEDIEPINNFNASSPIFSTLLSELCEPSGRF
jgi:hypothetical protein